LRITYFLGCSPDEWGERAAGRGADGGARCGADDPIGDAAEHEPRDPTSGTWGEPAPTVAQMPRTKPAVPP